MNLNLKKATVIFGKKAELKIKIIRNWLSRSIVAYAEA